MTPNEQCGRVSDPTGIWGRRVQLWEVLREFKECGFSYTEFEDLWCLQI